MILKLLETSNTKLCFYQQHDFHRFWNPTPTTFQNVKSPGVGQNTLATKIQPDLGWHAKGGTPSSIVTTSTVVNFSLMEVKRLLRTTAGTLTSPTLMDRGA